MNYNIHIIDSFLKSKADRKPNSLRSITADCKVLSQYLSENELSIFQMNNNADFTQYANWLKEKYSSRTVHRRLCTLRAVIKYCEDQKIIAKQKDILSIEQKFDPIILAETRIISLLYNYCLSCNADDNYFQCRDKMIFLFMIVLGLKPSEICSIRVDDIHEQELFFTNSIGKTEYRLWEKDVFREQFDVYMKKRNEWLRKQGASSDSLFIDRFGNEITPDNIKNAFQKIKKNCSIVENVTLSSIRNRCILDYYEQMPDSLLISKIFDITKTRIDKLVECSVSIDTHN